MSSGAAGGGGGSYADSNYETKYQKSLRHYLTREALPSEANYRNLTSVLDGNQRPTLDELHDATFHGDGQGGKPNDAEAAARGPDKGLKFGWLQGVLMVCLLNIWGVMLFLRISWIVAQCGIAEGLAVIVTANIVTFITALSMSAIATNGLIEGGGVYYMISRSLGPEFGGSIGLLFSLANSIAVATYIIGFVNSLQDMCKGYFATIMLDGGENDVRAVGTGVLLALLILAIVGMKWVQRAQMGLLVLLIAAQIDFVIGVLLGPLDEESQARGFVGLSSEVLGQNLYSDYRRAEGTIQTAASTFAVFFPAVTGITAGANLSGDLKDPSFAIPLGTLLAIAITFVTYIGYPILLAATVVRDASGDVDRWAEYYYNDTGFQDGSKSVLDNPVYTTASCSMAGEGILNPINENITQCEYGSMNSFQIMELVSAWGPLIYVGCFAATLSSAIASLTGAPRILQALAKDKLYPGIFLFSKGMGPSNDPVNGYILVFFISLGCIMIGNLNAVSTLLSNFFLASYCLINISCFHASLIKSPGWRPSFKFYNCWVSLMGGVLCLVVMFLVDSITALGTFLVIIALYLFVQYRKPDVNWGSSTQAAIYKSALASALELQNVEEHVKNFRPQILVMCGQPSSRPPLVDFANIITKNVSLLTCGHVSKTLTHHQRSVLLRRSYNWLNRHKIKAFCDLVEADELSKGAMDMFQLSGLGKMRPNILLIGYKTNWNKCNRIELMSYFDTLHGALNMQMGVAILRMPHGLNFSHIIEDIDATPSLEKNNEGFSDDPSAAGPDSSTLDLDADGSTSVESTPPATPEPTRNAIPAFADMEMVEGANKRPRRKSLSNLYLGVGGAKLPKNVLNDITVFQRKQKKGTIDVWWLYDDGGLTLLLPYILTSREKWSSCKLRIFALANRKDELDMEQRSMARLLSKFRIDYGDVIVIPDAMRKAAETSKTEFDSLITQFKTEEEVGDGCTLTSEELASQKEKTNRHIRLREMLHENSKEANLIVMTLPMPRKSHVSASLYMAWLEFISKGMPPFLFIRGNQQSVLTFYS